MKAAQLALGFAVALALLIAAVWLWLHNLIIFAAPVGALAAGAAWVTVDNILIYPDERARREAATAQPAQPSAGAEAQLLGAPPEPSEINAPQ
ncbi:MAG: hypothetical protein ACREN2_13320 [Candidatus Dormibacteria bacterium]